MQRSLKRYVGRPSAQGAGQKAPPEQAGPSKPACGKPRSSSWLLAALGSQVVRDDGGSAEAAAASQAQPQQALRELPTNPQGAQPSAVQQPCVHQHPRSSKRTRVDHPMTHFPRQPPQQQAPQPGMQTCPLCGELLPDVDALQQHLNEELDSMEGQGWAETNDRPSSSSAPPPSQPPWQQQQQQQWQQARQEQWPPRQQQQAAVLVLGGAPSVTAPTDRRRLAQLQRQRVLPPKRPRQLPANEFNFYDDGRGGWGGEDIGLDGEAGGLKWEGMGTTDF